MLLMLFEAVVSEGKGRSSFEPFRWQSHAVTNNKKNLIVVLLISHLVASFTSSGFVKAVFLFV